MPHEEMPGSERVLELAVSVSETARMIGAARRTVYVLVRSGRLGSVRLGRRIVITAKSVERLLQNSDAEHTKWGPSSTEQRPANMKKGGDFDAKLEAAH